MKITEDMRNKIFLILIFLVIALGLYMLYMIRTQSFQCISNPAAYAIKNIEKGSKTTVQCTCISFSETNRVTFSINDKGIVAFNPFTGNITAGTSNQTQNISG